MRTLLTIYEKSFVAKVIIKAIEKKFGVTIKKMSRLEIDVEADYEVMENFPLATCSTEEEMNKEGGGE